MKALGAVFRHYWPRGRTKQQEQNIKQLEVKLEHLCYKRDALKEEIMKELVRGDMPNREFRIWLDKGEIIVHRVHKLLDARTKGCVLGASDSAEKPEHLMSRLECEITKYLEASPFDQGPGNESPHKIMKSKRSVSLNKFRKVKAEEKGGAISEPVEQPLKIQLKTKTNAEVALKQVDKEEVTESTLPCSPGDEEEEMIDITFTVPCSPGNEEEEMTEFTLPYSPSTQAKGIMAGEAISEMTTHQTSSANNPNKEEADLHMVCTAKHQEVKNATTRESTGAESATNMATPEPVSMQVTNETSSRPSLPTSLKAAEKLQTKKSIQSMVQKIILSKSKIIGLYGLGGIGKTSILRALLDDPKVKQKFDPIIWVNVSRCWSTRKIQEEVVRQLPFHSGSTATSLFHTLEKKRFLLILDDVWEKIDLNEVGIPCSNSGNGCKLIMTTQSVDLCRDMAAKEIRVASLSSEDSWELFYEQVGKCVDSPDIEPYARGIVNECGGLPLSIIVVGKALSGESDVSEWKLAMKYFLLPKNGDNGVEPLTKHLNFCYERLKVRARKNPKPTGSEIQICFIYCARFPEDFEVNVLNLIEYWIQEGLISGYLEDSRKKGHDIVKILVDAALLENTRDGVCVRMHGEIRDLASSLISAKVRQFTFRHETTEECDLSSSEGHEHLFKAGAELTETPPEKEWEGAKIISLEDNDLSILPAMPNCPKLLTLSLQRNSRLRGLPVSFFDQMPHLKVLNMSKTRIATLPRSIENLHNLIQLNLRDCECLTSLPPELGKLKRIELLDLHGTVLNELPEAVGELEFLKDLEISFYGPLEQREYSKLPSELIPRGIISKLHHLNNLSIAVKPGDRRWNDIVESIITEMHDLSNLTSLKFYFPELRLLSLFQLKNNSWRNKSLKKFSFIVGYDNKRMLSRVPHDVELDYNQHDRCVRLVNERSPPPEAIKQVVAHTTSFYLDHHLNISSLSQLGARNIIGLEFCVVRECPIIEYIINGKELALPFLEHLGLYYLEKLTGIWNGKDQLQHGSFASLKCLSVHTCRQLEFVFTTAMCQSVPNLEELVVEDCQAIKNVISEQSLVKFDHPMLPKMKKLRLSYLPNLVSIWGGTTWPSLEDVSFYFCPKLKNLNMGSGSGLKVSIKEIKAEKEWWDLLDSDESSLYSYFVHRNVCKWI